MPTTFRLIGLNAEPIVSPPPGFLVDMLIQNLSANNIEVGSSQELAIGTGIEIAANGNWPIEKRHEPVFLIADGAGSDVRIFYELYKAGSR